MKFDALSANLQMANKVFVWVEMSTNNCVFLQMTKRALLEYFRTCATLDPRDDYYAHFDETTKELYIGAPPDEEKNDYTSRD